MGELGFWVAVGFAAVAALALFKLGAGTRLGEVVPGYRELAAFV